MTSFEGRTTLPDVAEWAENGLRTGIAAVFVEGVRRRNPGAIVNAIVALGATYLPAIVERRCTVEFRSWQRIYVETAMLTHTIGMLGPYDDVWWWDHLTHVHSATLIGGLIHVISRRLDVDPRPRVLVGVATMGVLWEVVEYIAHVVSRQVNLEPVLVSYGKIDTLLDLVFNIVGAVLVLAFGDTLLGNLIRHSNE
ncbi:hypothetical protein [Halegenticoccus tardaugens]|uniref:hypothetical protein n=1 Tax=Halegenticoccus tardaugens TaxID=2071624 RepID=UPI00100ADC10|nr:hypothetical protein [Halegenticoccus tardaugens]